MSGTREIPSAADRGLAQAGNQLEFYRAGQAGHARFQEAGGGQEMALMMLSVGLRLGIRRNQQWNLLSAVSTIPMEVPA